MNNKKAIKILIIIILILLIIILILCYRLGRIGYMTVPTSAQITVSDDSSYITNNTRLNIFDIKKIDGTKIIYPMANGSYNFSIQNNLKTDAIYQLIFTEENANDINMRYKLKVGNIYIRGNKEEYVTADELEIEDMIVPKGSTNVFTLEWCWINDNENDTYVASLEEDQSYTINLVINTQEYVRRSN